MFPVLWVFNQEWRHKQQYFKMRNGLGLITNEQAAVKAQFMTIGVSEKGQD